MVEQMHPVLVAKPTPEATQRQSHSRTCAPSAPATIVGGQGLLLPLMFWPDLCFGSLGVPFSISCSSIVPYDLHMSHGRRSVLFIAQLLLFYSCRGDGQTLTFPCCIYKGIFVAFLSLLATYFFPCQEDRFGPSLCPCSLEMKFCSHPGLVLPIFCLYVVPAVLYFFLLISNSKHVQSCSKLASCVNKQTYTCCSLYGHGSTPLLLLSPLLSRPRCRIVWQYAFLASLCSACRSCLFW